MRGRSRFTHFDKDAAGSTGGGGTGSSTGSTGSGGGGASTIAASFDGTSLSKRWSALVKKHGSEPAAARALVRENIRLRQAAEGKAEAAAAYKSDTERELEDAEREIDRLGALVPKPGAVVLTGDDAKAWETLKALGKPEEVRARLEAGDKAVAKLADQDAEKLMREAAGAVKWNPDALPGVLKIHGLALEMRDTPAVDDKGKPTTAKMPFVRPAGDEKAAWVPLNAEYAEKNLKTYVPVLTAGVEHGGGNGSTSTRSGSGSTGSGGARRYPTTGSTRTTPTTRTGASSTGNGGSGGGAGGISGAVSSTLTRQHFRPGAKPETKGNGEK